MFHEVRDHICLYTTTSAHSIEPCTKQSTNIKINLALIIPGAMVLARKMLSFWLILKLKCKSKTNIQVIYRHMYSHLSFAHTYFILESI